MPRPRLTRISLQRSFLLALPVISVGLTVTPSWPFWTPLPAAAPRIPVT